MYFPGLALSQSDEALDVGRSNGRVHEQQRRRYSDPPDRREVADRVVWQVFVQSGIDGIGGHRRHQQRVTVGVGLCDRVGADIAAGTDPVLDHELLSQQFSHLRSHNAPDDVGRAAGSERNNHLHWPRWIIIRGLHARAHARQRHYRDAGRQSTMLAHEIPPLNFASTITFRRDTIRHSQPVQRVKSPLLGLPHLAENALVAHRPNVDGKDHRIERRRCALDRSLLGFDHRCVLFFKGKTAHLRDFLL